MTDSRPIVAMLGNQQDRPEWVTNRLITEDIEGKKNIDLIRARRKFDEYHVPEKNR